MRRWEVVRRPDGSVGVVVTPYMRWTCTVPRSVALLRTWAQRAGETELAEALGDELVHMAENGWG
ncbi:hypothetical protein [Tsukamurella pseudospumae]|uniref:Uncharacterized protein n=1 Tax=Tsukamurella pseudospumae TaxID=239498 RepID=A0A138ATY9_9ACTN|nr:hypothetical protein [Tsukamurella pseudospumae]KXP13915.1 hypothetical protein AXK60_22695 [Tsukamurella pseudospumae]